MMQTLINSHAVQSLICSCLLIIIFVNWSWNKSWWKRCHGWHAWPVTLFGIRFDLFGYSIIVPFVRLLIKNFYYFGLFLDFLLFYLFTYLWKQNYVFIVQFELFILDLHMTLCAIFNIRFTFVILLLTHFSDVVEYRSQFWYWFNWFVQFFWNRFFLFFFRFFGWSRSIVSSRQTFDLFFRFFLKQRLRFLT